MFLIPLFLFSVNCYLNSQSLPLSLSYWKGWGEGEWLICNLISTWCKTTTTPLEWLRPWLNLPSAQLELLHNSGVCYQIKPKTNSFYGEASLEAMGYTWPALMIRYAEKRNKEDELITNLWPDKTFRSRKPGRYSNQGINVQMATAMEKVKENGDVTNENIGYLHQSAVLESKKQQQQQQPFIEDILSQWSHSTYKYLLYYMSLSSVVLFLCLPHPWQLSKIVSFTILHHTQWLFFPLESQA